MSRIPLIAAALAGASMLPVSPAAAACDGSSAQVTCAVDESGAYFTGTVTDLTISGQTGDVTVSTGSPAVGLALTGSNGGNGEDGEFDPDDGDSGGSTGAMSLTLDLGTTTLTGASSSVAAALLSSTGGTGGTGGNNTSLFEGTAANGGSGGGGGDVTLTLDSGTLATTQGSANAIDAESLGGDGGDGGEASAAGESNGGDGGFGGDAGAVTVLLDSTAIVISTKGDESHGILALSQGGQGGDGGATGGGLAEENGGDGKSGGAGGTVSVTSKAAITTDGTAAHPIFAQSLGGNGGSGGPGGGFTIGGTGGQGASSGAGGDVQVANEGKLVTTGTQSTALFAQSIGGFAGDGGSSSGLLWAGGGSASAGDGGTVDVTNSGEVETGQNLAYGIFAQSVGGGGGFGGVSAGLVAVGGNGSAGGDGNDVSVDNTGRVRTSGDDSHALFAQSVGGGGGAGGNSAALGLFVSVAVGGDGGGAGNGGNVAVNTDVGSASSTLTTEGARSHGLFAQSVGGAGGAGGFAFSASVGIEGDASIAIGGDGGDGGNGGDVTAMHRGTITTKGHDSDGILAQSVGGGGGHGGFSMPISFSAGASFAVGVGGSGGGGGDAGDVTVEATTDVTTAGFHSHGIVANSQGGGGGGGGFDLSLAAGADVGISVGLGGSGGSGGTGGAVSLTSRGTVHTSGNNSHGLFAQSVGGGGGDGGFAIGAGVGLGGGGLDVTLAGNGGDGQTADTVTVVNTGAITTEGKNSHGIIAQSIGGGGGHGGFVVGASGGSDAGLGVTLGGDGGSGSNGAETTVTNSGAITTTGVNATGILAQSGGGGGGDGGFSVSADVGAAPIAVNLGGSGGSGSTGGIVTVTNSGAIATSGGRAKGIFAQSVGGGGGNSGFTATGELGFPDADTSADIAVTIGRTGGSGDDASAVTVTNSGKVTTEGATAHGVVAQSVGGGGGSGGFVATFEAAVSASPSGSYNAGVTLGGEGGAAGNGGTVTLDNTAAVTTSGDHAYGLLAQSVGGGGGDGGFAVSGTLQGKNANVTIGRGGGTGGTGGDVMLTSGGTVKTSGHLSHGVFAQSVGGGGGAGGFAAGVSATIDTTANSSDSNPSIATTLGGDGADGASAGDVTATVSGNVETSGSGAHAVFAQSVGGSGGAGGFAGSLSAVFGSSGSFSTAIGGTGGDGSTGGSGGTAAKVVVENHATVSTSGERASGILAQSVGGGGGTGGMSVDAGASVGSGSDDVAVAVGGGGGTGNHGGFVSLTNHGAVTTTGLHAHALAAQSVGGGGGTGGMSFTGAIGVAGTRSLSSAWGGSGGAGGDGGDVELSHDAGAIETSGKFASAVFAQSVGGGGGAGGSASTLTFSGTSVGTSSQTTVNAGWTMGGSGGASGTGGKVTVTNAASIKTTGVSADGIIAQSVGGGGGVGGNAFTGVVGVATEESTEKSKYVNLSVAHGGGGGDGNDGGTVSVTNSGSVTTENGTSNGIFAQSVGGGGGAGGHANTLSLIVAAKCPDGNVAGQACKDANNEPTGESKNRNVDLKVTMGGSGGGASDGGSVTVANSGSVTTKGEDSEAIFAQSIGGGGGAGGEGTIGTDNMFDADTGDIIETTEGFAEMFSVEASKSYSVTLGGSGGSSGDGGSVTITQSAGTLSTSGSRSHAIFAQSVGGGGGVGGTAADGTSGTVGLGGSGGAAGKGGAVTVELTGGTVSTSGSWSHGVFAQSVGGGGGTGGDVDHPLVSTPTVFNQKPSFGIGLNKLLQVAGGGGGGGDGGDVTVTSDAAITVTGAGSIGIVAQSVGGGGGTTGAGIDLKSADDVGDANSDVLGEFEHFWGSVGYAGSGGTVSVTANAKIEASGEGGHGIFAQSAGGTGKGGAVTVDINADVSATGSGSVGALIQSRGDEGGGTVSVTIAEGVTVQGTSSALHIEDGSDNRITNHGTLTNTSGVSAFAVYAGSAADTLDNYGTLIGSVSLGEGANVLENKSGGDFRPGATVDLGSDGTLYNYGTLSPGGSGSASTIQTTAITGSAELKSGGTYLVDVDLSADDSGTKADKLTVTKSLTVGGTIRILPINALDRDSDSGTIEIASAGTLSTDGATITSSSHMVTASVEVDQTSGTAKLAYTVDLTPETGGNANHQSIQAALATHETLRHGRQQTAAALKSAALLPAGAAGAPPAGAAAQTVEETDTGSLDPLVELLFAQEDGASLNAIYDALSPEPFAINEVLTIRASELFVDNLAHCGAGGGALATHTARGCSWLQAAGRRDHANTTDESLGYDQSTFTFAGGFDLVLADGWSLGGAVSWEQASVTTSTAADSDADRYQAGLALAHDFGATRLGVTAFGGFARYDVSRPDPVGGSLEADQDMTWVGGGVHLAHAIPLGVWTLAPAFDATVTHVMADDFAETGGTSALEIEDRDETYFALTPSVTARGRYALQDDLEIRPFVRAGVTWRPGNDAAESTASFAGAASGTGSFTVDHDIDQVTGRLDLGLDIASAAGIGVGVGLQGEWGANSASYGASLRVKIPF